MSLSHNIICFEAEWILTDIAQKKDKVDTRTASLLDWLSAAHRLDVIHRTVLNKAALEHYMQLLSPQREGMDLYDIVYIASHGDVQSVCFDVDTLSLHELAELGNAADGFFENRIVHFGCCKTAFRPDAVLEFKQVSGARLVTGYTKTVDTMKASIAEAALLNYLVTKKNVGIIANRDKSEFWKTYGSLLEELGFEAF